MTIEVSQAQSRARSRSRWLLAVGLAVLVAAGIGVWRSVLEERFIPKRFGVVEQGRIYRSGQISASLVKKVLVEYDIKVVIDLTADDPNNSDQRAERRSCGELGIQVVNLPLRGNGTGDVNNYAIAVISIAQAVKKGTPVLVHCAAGTQRTGGVIAAYRLLVQKKGPDLVISELKRYGWSPKGNPALLTYIDSNMGELAMLLKQAGVIDEVPEPLPQLH